MTITLARMVLDQGLAFATDLGSRASVRRRDGGVGFGGTGAGRVNNPDAGGRTWTRPD